MRSLSVLAVFSELPMADRDPSGARQVAILSALAAGGHTVTVLARTGVGQESYAGELAGMGMEVIIRDARHHAGATPDAVALDFAGLLRRGAFDVAWLTIDDVADHYVAEIRWESPGTRIVVDGVGAHHLATRPVCGQADVLVCRDAADEAGVNALASQARTVIVTDGPAQDGGAGTADIAGVLDAVVGQVIFAATAFDDLDTLTAVLRGYLGCFAPGDPAVLVAPVPAGGVTIEQAGAWAGEALARLGADPEQIPDVTVAATAADPAVPLNATLATGADAPTATADDPAAADDPTVADHPVAPAEPPALASIIICAYGKRDYSERCLRSLQDALGDRLGTTWELVLVDNASPDDTAALFAAWSDRATVVSLPENRNFAGGNNAGAEVARGEVLVFLNNDTEVGPGALEAIVQEARQPGVGIVGTRLLYPDGRIQHGGLAWRSRPTEIEPFHFFHFEPDEVPAARTTFDISAVTGACMALPAEVFHRLGGFDERYVNGWEDSDLCMRARWAGHRVRLRGDVHIVHHEGVTSRGDYQRDGNKELFHAQWGAVLRDERDVVNRTLGAVFNPISDVAIGPVSADGAPVLVAGPVVSVGPSGDEARGLLDALAAAGTEAASRPATPNWIAPALADAHWRRLLASHARALRPGAVTVHVGGGEVKTAHGPLVLRLAGATPDRPADALAWVSCGADRAALLEAGWPADAVTVLPAAGIEPLDGAGGGGVLVVLPAAHAPAVAILKGLCGLGLPRLRIVPTIRSGELAAHIAAILPGAELLAPETDERVVQRLAAAADVVVALNEDDGFDRQALAAAATGAAVVVRPGRAAAEVLGELVHIADPADPAAVTAAVGAAGLRIASEDRRRRRARVIAACGPETVRAALDRLAAAV